MLELGFFSESTCFARGKIFSMVNMSLVSLFRVKFAQILSAMCLVSLPENPASWTD